MTLPARPKYRSWLAALAVALAACGCGKKPEPGAPNAPASDKDRLQGNWVAESGERGGEPFPADELAELKDDWLQIRDDKLTMWHRGFPHDYTLALDEKAEPKAMILTPLDTKTGKRGQHTGRANGTVWAKDAPKKEFIYKFDSDTLVIAAVMDRGDKRPKEFRQPDPADEEKVVVIRFRKTTDAPPARPATTKK